MTITLEGVTLPDIVWIDQFEDTTVNAIVKRTLSGRLIIHERKIEGRFITLAGEENTGWIEHSILSSIYDLAAVANATYELNYEGTLYNVRFRNEDQPAISAVPLVQRPNYSSTDYYKNLLIKLMEI